MSRSRGEGRTPAEKKQRVRVSRSVLKEQRERELAEEAEWAARCGPVTVRKIEE